MVLEPTICEVYKIKQKYSKGKLLLIPNNADRNIANDEIYDWVIADTSGNEEYKEI